MLQVPFIRENKDLVINRLAKRNIDASDMINQVITLDEERRSIQTKLDNTLADSNTLSKEIGILYKSGKAQEANLLKEKTSELKESSKQLNEDLNNKATELNELLYKIPNVPNKLVPAGNTDEDNEEVFKIWGTGEPKREFMHVDDMASACVHLMGIDTGDFYRDGFVNAHVNIGTGVDCTIKELVEQISNVTGYNGIINWDITKPEGTQRKLLNTTKLESFGWKSGISLVKGLEQTYQWFVSEYFDSLNKPTQKP